VNEFNFGDEPDTRRISRQQSDYAERFSTERRRRPAADDSSGWIGHVAFWCLIGLGLAFAGIMLLIVANRVLAVR